MTFTSWRGTVGVIHPRKSSSNSFQDLIRILPEGVGVVPDKVNILGKQENDYRIGLGQYLEKVTNFVEMGLDVIHPEGAPPFMLDGYKGEQKLIGGWTRKFKRPIFTTGMTQLAAMKALNVKKFVGMTPHLGRMSDIFSQYFTDAGFKVMAMVRPFPPEVKVVRACSAEEVYAYVKKAFLAQRGGADAIYTQSSEFRVIDIIEELEQDLGVPVISPLATRGWYIQKTLHIREPIKGFGHLLATVPQ
jgi:maleate isomerase